MADLRAIKERITEELQPSRGERGKYICPICGSGSHGNGSTAALSIEKDGLRAHCFSCNFHGDIFDLVAARDGISLQEATRALIAKYQPGEASPRRSTAAEDFSSYRAEKPAAGPRKDFSDYVAKAHAALPGSEGERYLMSRGFTPETLERFLMGYEPDHYFPGRGTFPAVVFPYDRGGHYVGWRAITEKHYDKPKTAEAGDEPVFNAGALYADGPVFVVESQLCAISLEQCGGRAVAIGGSGARKLLRQVEEKPPAGPLLLALDNDEKGQEAQAAIVAGLEGKGVPFLQVNPAGDQKDPNDLLKRDPAALEANVAEILRGVAEEQARQEAERLEARNQESAAGYIDSFLEELQKSKAAPAIPTGFPGLDRLLDGGLYPGLYVIGAITSLGKSTFSLQIADQIAAAGHDVLCFNLEMARAELMAKSISRLTYQIADRNRQPLKLARSTRDILASRKWDYFSREAMELMAAAVEEYKSGASAHIWHYEGVGDIGVEQIKAEVERHIGITGRLPVVFVDYLQILAAPDVKMSDKQAVDKNVLELKRLSRDKGIPVFCISSLNRDNYTEPINNAAFKESGAVEYSSDCLMGLQFEGMDYKPGGESDKDRRKRIRDLITAQKAEGNAGRAERIELKILKNRNGKAGTSESLLYTPRFNLYVEDSGFTPADDTELPEEWQESGQAAKPKRIGR